MVQITLDGEVFDTDDFAGFGNVHQTKTIDGVEYPYYLAIWVAGLSELSNRAAQVAGTGSAFRLAFSTTTTDADPGAGTFRLNAATQNTATEIYIDDTDAGGATISAVLATWDDSTSVNKGMLSVRDPASATKYLLFQVTGITVASGYTKVQVTLIGSSAASPFADDDTLVIGFVRTGDRGDQGGSYSYAFSDTTTDSDPGAGTLRVNNADLSAVTEIYIDDTDAGGTDITPDILSWDDPTSATKGHLIIRGSPDTTDYVRYRVTGLTDNAGYVTLQVVHVVGTGTGFLADGESITVTYSRAGDQGDPGTSMRYQWSTSTTASDPGAGYMRANNADLSAATAIYIDDAEAGGTDISALLATWDDSTSTIKGVIVIRGKADPTDFVVFTVSAVADNSGYFTLTVSHVAGSATAPFSADDEIYISFARTGDKGDTGADGDVVGPVSSTDNALVRWDGAGGNSVQSSAWTLSDAGLLSGAGSIDLTASSTEGRYVQIGLNRSGDGSSYVDLIGDATYTDYGARLLRAGGASSATSLLHRGTGALTISAEDAGSLAFSTNGSSRLTVSSAGAFDFQGSPVSRARPGTSSQTGTTYTTDADDVGTWIDVTNASGTTVTLHDSPGEGASIGFVQRGAGQITFSPNSGTLRNRQSHTKSAGQYAVCMALYLDGEWHLAGDTAS